MIVNEESNEIALFEVASPGISKLNFLIGLE
jgi:hypothetical protein